MHQESWQAMERAIQRNAREVARALGVSTGLVYKWMEPSTDYTDSGAYNPLDRLETIIQTALNLGRKQKTAFAPLFWLAQRFGLAVFFLPKITPQKEVSLSLLRTVVEFGDLAREASAALVDGKITPLEARRIEKEGWELIRQTLTFISTAQKEAKNVS